MKWMFFLFIGSLVCSQTQIVVYDLENDEPISGAQVLAQGKSIGNTNPRGEFTVDKVYNAIQIIKEGYYTANWTNNSDATVYMQRREVNLSEFVISNTDDGARELIKRAIKGYNKNAPESLPSYMYKSYTKFLVLTDRDKIKYVDDPKSKSDSAQNKFRKFLDESHFFLSERGMDHLYNQQKGKKNIVQASRISGVKIPLYELVAQQPISHSFSENELNFLSISFTNPLSRKGLNDYRYKISDTLQIDGRATVEVQFYPKTKEKTDKNKIYGSLFVDLQDAALVEFQAQSLVKHNASELEMAFSKNRGAWFPKKQYFSLDIGNVVTEEEEDSIAPDGTIVVRPVKKQQPMWARIQSRFFDVESPKEFEKRQLSGFENEVSKMAFDDADIILPRYRGEPLDSIEAGTYVKIDSIGKEAKVDKYARLIRVISRDGRLEIGKYDLNLNQLFAYNAYEGFRLGLGGGTNYRLSEHFDLYGYGAYGFKDKEFKYGFGANFHINKRQAGKLFVEYLDDVAPAGRNEWELQSQFLRNQLRGFENFYNANFYDFAYARIGYQQDFYKKFTAKLALSAGDARSRFNYRYLGGTPDEALDFYSSKLSLRWTPENESLNTPFGKVTLSNRTPHIHFSVQRFWSIGNAGYDPTKFNFDVYHDFYNFAGHSKVTLRTGLLLGEAPIFELFEGHGNNRLTNSGNNRFGVSGQNTFETMVAGSFYADRFLSFQMRHQFAGVRVFKKEIYPEFIYRTLIGGMRQPELHTNIIFEIPNNWYQEVGVELNGLFFGSLGVGAYYRIGAYEGPDFSDNFAVRLTISPTFARP